MVSNPVPRTDKPSPDNLEIVSSWDRLIHYTNSDVRLPGFKFLVFVSDNIAAAWMSGDISERIFLIACIDQIHFILARGSIEGVLGTAISVGLSIKNVDFVQ